MVEGAFMIKEKQHESFCQLEKIWREINVRENITTAC